MAIGVPRIGAHIGKTTGTSLAVPYPVSSNAPVAEDLMLIFSHHASTVLSVVPVGWADLYSRVVGGTNTPAMRIYSKRAVGGETGTVTIASPNVTANARMVVVSGVDETTPLDMPVQTFESMGTLRFGVPSFNVLSAGVTLLGVAQQNTSTGTWAPPVNPAAWTELHEYISAAPKSTTAYLSNMAAGSTGLMEFVANASSRGQAAVLALRPAGAAAGGRPKVWTGSAWEKKPAKVWTGSAWVEKPVKVWTGSTWKTV